MGKFLSGGHPHNEHAEKNQLRNGFCLPFCGSFRLRTDRDLLGSCWGGFSKAGSLRTRARCVALNYKCEHHLFAGASLDQAAAFFRVLQKLPVGTI